MGHSHSLSRVATADRGERPSLAPPFPPHDISSSPLLRVAIRATRRRPETESRDAGLRRVSDPHIAAESDAAAGSIFLPTSRTPFEPEDCEIFLKGAQLNQARDGRSGRADDGVVCGLRKPAIKCPCLSPFLSSPPSSPYGGFPFLSVTEKWEEGKEKGKGEKRRKEPRAKKKRGERGKRKSFL